jgi:hypothetical protein
MMSRNRIRIYRPNPPPCRRRQPVAGGSDGSDGPADSPASTEAPASVTSELKMDYFVRGA